VQPSAYPAVVQAIISAVSEEQGLYLAGVVLLKTKSIPKTTSGKISRASCRKAFLEGTLQVVHQWDDLEVVVKPRLSTGSGGSPTSVSTSALRREGAAEPVAAAALREYTLEEVRSRITAMVQDVTGLTEVAGDAVLLDIGLTSAAATELSGRLANEFGVRIRPTVVFTNPTIDDVAARVLELMAALRTASAAPLPPTASLQPVSLQPPNMADWLRPEAFIAGWGIAVPFPLSAETFLEIDRREREKRGQSEEVIQQMAQFVKASRIKNRHTCHPFFLPEGRQPSDYPNAVGTTKEDIYAQYPDNRPPLTKRMECYQDTAVKLCVAAAEKAVRNWGKDRSKITHLLTTCTSGWTEPGIGCAVIKGLGLSQDVQKAELNFNGCFCGATCLRLARDIIRAGDAEAVLIVACEVATTHYDWSHTEIDRMVAQSLFADGAASLVVAKEGVWRYTQTGSAIVPDSGHLLGLRPPMQEGETSYIMTLSKLVSPSLYAYFSKGHGKDIISKLYNPRDRKPALAIHPGGPRILEAVGDVFFELGWKEDSLRASYDTFGHYGNLGSAAMLFVLATRLSSGDIEEDKLITMAFGPGVTVEYAQLERATPANSNAAVQAAAIAALRGAPVPAADAAANRKVTAEAKAAVLKRAVQALVILLLGVLLGMFSEAPYLLK
jgi:predicted naringenin-chalcone synthase/acyl carrier protein